jgi:hypothetical protein
VEEKPVNGVGKGTQLAGRYRLEERVSESPHGSLWRGVDTTLDRTVAVRIIGALVAAESLDAARRAALVDDPRLVRLLDVAQEQARDGGTTTFVISEWVEGQSLADLLHDTGPLAADKVRMLVGEAAEALDVASGRGLHHLALDPTSVILTRDGAVKVHGLAVDAAAEGGAQPDGRGAERVDAVGLVALAYAGLTGRWPLPTRTRGAHPLDPAPLSGELPVPPAQLVAGVPNDLDTLCSVTLGAGDDGPRSPGELAAQLRPWPSQSGYSGNANRRLAEDLRAAPRRPPSRFPVMLAPTRVEIDTSDVAVTGPVAGAAGLLSGPQRQPQRSTASGDTDGPDLHKAGPSRPGLRSSDTSRLIIRPAGADSTEPSAGTPTPEAGRNGDPGGPEGGEGPTKPTRTRSPGQSRVAVLAILALVVVGLVLAVLALGGLGGKEVTSPSASTTSTTSAPPVAAPVIADVTAYDPQGDDTENDDTAALINDGDPATVWKSSTYKSQAFGGLKDGVGVIITLQAPAPVHSITVETRGEGGNIEVRTAPSPTLDGSQVLGAGPAGTITVTPDPAPTTQYLIIWVTELPVTDGQNRAEIGQVTLT